MTEQRGPGLRPWTPEESAKAAELWRRHFTDVYGDDAAGPWGARGLVVTLIGEAIGRSYHGVSDRLKKCGPKFGANLGDRRAPRGCRKHPEAPVRVDAGTLAACAAYRRALDQRDVTAATFGDPPPGYSALDRKRQGAAP